MRPAEVKTGRAVQHKQTDPGIRASERVQEEKYMKHEEKLAGTRAEKWNQNRTQTDNKVTRHWCNHTTAWVGREPRQEV